LRWASLERSVLEKAVEITKVLIGGVDVLVFFASIAGKVLDGFDFLFLEAPGGVFGVIEIVAEKIERPDGAVER
jgi:hypothetical protein